jgi:hypothetical protein
MAEPTADKVELYAVLSRLLLNGGPRVKILDVRALAFIGIWICCMSIEKFANSKFGQSTFMFSGKDWIGSSPARESLKQLRSISR